MFCEKDTTTQSQLPVLILSFTLAVFLGVQTYLLASDRAVIKDSYERQSQILSQIEKTKNQTNALIKGVIDLSKADNKNAVAIIDNLKKAGITFQDDAAVGGKRQAPHNAASQPSGLQPMPQPVPPQKKR